MDYLGNVIGDKIKAKAIELGFDSCRFAKADFLAADRIHLENWLNAGFNAEMHYMSRNFEKRVDPRLLVENAKTIVSVIINYYQPEAQLNTRFKISKYAYGSDYHKVIKNKLFELMNYMENAMAGEKIIMRAFVDSAPVLDRRWGVKAGHGWIGKNSMLINKSIGSFFFIGEIITSLELTPDPEFIGDFCGKCTACIDACPTKAILAPKVIDSNHCISYQTIEKKESIDDRIAVKAGSRIFGCDICQDVCPWNSKAKRTIIDEFIISEELASMKDSDWEELSEDDFSRLFANSALQRAGYKKIKDNISKINYNKS